MRFLKQQLFDACDTYVNNRITSLENDIKDIQQSANEETKSSAGDKYETGRSMAQLEIDKYQGQLAEAKRMKQELSRIRVDTKSDVIRPGSLIFTSRGNFFIAINAGQQQLSDLTFFTISTSSPIAQKLIGLKEKDTFSLNQQEFTILEIQ